MTKKNLIDYATDRMNNRKYLYENPDKTITIEELIQEYSAGQRNFWRYKIYGEYHPKGSLDDIKFRDADFSRAQFTDIYSHSKLIFYECNLHDTYWNGDVFKRGLSIVDSNTVCATFENIDFGERMELWTGLHDVIFSKIVFREQSYEFPNIFRHCYLHKVVFDMCTFKDVNIYNSRLEKTLFNNVDFNNTKINYCNLEKCEFKDVDNFNTIKDLHTSKIIQAKGLSASQKLFVIEQNRISDNNLFFKRNKKIREALE